ncbi:MULTISPECIES: DUF6302 family protein [Streptomyces]|uniref:Uncharacterized protein n=1 Tax=Streptomyces tsukubensis (strain DSM 42081 / NBRC 108919 / NRRL 18488 / 9993) TaxID=1114943 RepID=I2N866_STRT9|nr:MULTISPECIES: DUF6302 family protein [Streptomyces]AZK97103.1 hypothetical protein B7R87_26965 [Streptomyces tsukubensis]EIF93213.1 hypothetical protein [Streptomyces tsukubensis NRRL18488]MYS67963.1 hypothetical protein [Streptomyces sp. SID5473]QKM66927.1 hypothetical protein STSU_006810 [Streptomyces tsukubensis NRRL18488]TAI44726.1 hypothetical protein EWI31_05430 [Streptomyces tsukubensis]
MFTTSACLPRLRLRPAARADSEYAYFRDRLSDPTLLARAVTLYGRRGEWLAVPVGGVRRGGFVSCPDVVLAVDVRALLMGRGGFPGVRMRWSEDRDTCHTVVWGERAPGVDDDEVLGRFYGYSEDAIAGFVGVLSRAVHSALSTGPVSWSGRVPPALSGGRS